MKSLSFHLEAIRVAILGEVHGMTPSKGLNFSSLKMKIGGG
jgi:hypothetical protein